MPQVAALLPTVRLRDACILCCAVLTPVCWLQPSISVSAAYRPTAQLVALIGGDKAALLSHDQVASRLREYCDSHKLIKVRIETQVSALYKWVTN